MPKVGEAWYEIGARDEKLVRAFSGAEQKAKSTGANIERGIGRGADAGFDRNVAAAGRFGGAIDAAGGKASRFGGVMTSLGSGILQGVGIAGFFGITAAAGAFVEGVGKAIGAASDLNETVSKVGVVFGKNAGEINRWAENSATALGLSKNAALGAAATYGNLFVALNLPGKAAADMSKSLVGLAGDLASFNNVPVDDALQALQSGLVGETEPLRRFGVNLNEATIAQKAMELGLIKSVKDGVTPAIKAQASYALIMDQTKTAQGDFARTSSGLANQQRISAARLEDAFARAGQAILPLAATVVPMLADALTSVVDWIGEVIRSLTKWADENRGLVDAVGTVVSILGQLVSYVLQNIGPAFEASFGWVGRSVGEAFDIVKFVVSGIIGAIRNVIDIASQIPGPWQETAKSMKTTLDGMQQSVESWGTSTRTEAAKTGASVTPSISGPIAAGAGTVAGAMQTGVVDPIAAGGASAVGAAAAAGKKTPAELAKALQDGRFDVKAAWESINEISKTTLGKQSEIASIQAFLTSDRMTAGLRSKRPEVRAEFEAWKTAAEERLWALRKGVPEIAQKTGVSYADALAAKKAEARTAAAKVAQAAKDKLEESNQAAYRYGQGVGHQYANGMRMTAAEVAKAAAALGLTVQKYLQLKSPAKEGPLSELGGPGGWGVRLGEQWSEGVLSTLGLANRSIDTLSAVTRSLAPGATAAGPVSNSYAQSWTGDVRIDLHVGQIDNADSRSIRDLGRSLGEEARLVLTRGPLLFSLDGSK